MSCCVQPKHTLDSCLFLSVSEKDLLVSELESSEAMAVSSNASLSSDSEVFCEATPAARSV